MVGTAGVVGGNAWCENQRCVVGCGKGAMCVWCVGVVVVCVWGTVCKVCVGHVCVCVRGPGTKRVQMCVGNPNRGQGKGEGDVGMGDWE